MSEQLRDRADDATPFTGEQVADLLRENADLRRQVEDQAEDIVWLREDLRHEQARR